MIVVVDIETRGLDARKFVTACLMKENGKKKHFYKKEDLWKYLLHLGKQEQKRRKVLNVYAHNHEFDFYGYADLTDKKIEYFSFTPFIASYYINKKKAINFLDSFAIWKFSLKKLGDMVGLPKLEMPEEFSGDNRRITKKKLKEIAPYVERDVEIVMKALLMIKERIKAEGIQIRRLYTISQIAIAYLVNTLKKTDKYDDMFFIKDRGMFHRTRFKEEIHEAYRGGICRAFKLGESEDTDYIDVNNLYGYSSTKIRFPNLRSEQKICEPLKYFSKEQILENIGVSKVLMHNKEDEYGVLAVRTGTGNYYPRKNKYVLGTYTNLEIKEAIENGWELINIEWSIIWREAENPFKEITPKLYELRKKLNNLFDDWFYKEMQNRGYGKMAQQKKGQEIIRDSVEKAQEYLSRNYEIMRGDGFDYLYKKDKEEERDKGYYAPIIPTLINAYARVNMFRNYKKIPYEDLRYSDTDSILMKSGHLNKFNIGNELGAFKIVGEKKILNSKGRKTYLYDDEVKVSGFRKWDITLEDFRKGQIKSLKMNTLKTSKDLKEVGGFSEEKRNLIEQEENNRLIDEMYEEERIFVDDECKNINFFMEDLEKINGEQGL